MKKMLIAVGLGLIASSVWAACTGPFCYDDTGASIQATVGVAGNLGLRSDTLTNILTSTPTATGQLVYCSDCSKTAVCVSSATKHHSFVALSSSSIVACF